MTYWTVQLKATWMFLAWEGWNKTVGGAPPVHPVRVWGRGNKAWPLIVINTKGILLKTRYLSLRDFKTGLPCMYMYMCSLAYTHHYSRVWTSRQSWADVVEGEVRAAKYTTERGRGGLVQHIHTHYTHGSPGVLALGLPANATRHLGVIPLVDIEQAHKHTPINLRAVHARTSNNYTEMRRFYWGFKNSLDILT